MLYNKDRGKPKVKADPYTRESFIAWLERQPSDKNYNWACDNGTCLFQQYLITHGEDWRDGCGNYTKLRVAVGDGIWNDREIFIALDRPWIFGAALERARAARG